MIGLLVKTALRVLKNIVDVIALIFAFLLLQLYLWIPVLFIITVFFASLFVPFRFMDYIDIITIITVLSVILSALLVIRKYLLKPFQKSKKKTTNRIKQNLASNEPLPAKKRNFANTDSYGDDTIQRSAALKKQKNKRDAANNHTSEENETLGGNNALNTLTVQKPAVNNYNNTQKSKLFTNNITDGSNINNKSFAKTQQNDTLKPADSLRPQYDNLQDYNSNQQNDTQKPQHNMPYNEIQQNALNNNHFNGNSQNISGGNLSQVQTPKPQPQMQTQQPLSKEQPRYLRTRKDPNLIIAEYSDRLEFYKRTITGLVYLATEPKDA